MPLPCLATALHHQQHRKILRAPAQLKLPPTVLHHQEHPKMLRLLHS